MNETPTHSELQTNTLSRLVSRMGSNLVLYTIIEATPNGVLVVGKDHSILYANPAACRFAGLSFDRFQELRLPSLLPLDDDPKLMLDLVRFVSTKQAPDQFRREIRLRNQVSNAMRSTEFVAIAPERGYDYYCIILIDIDRRLQLERELIRSNTFFRNLIDSSVDGIIASDMKGNIILFNQGAQSILGYSEVEAIGSLHVTRLYPEGDAYEIIQRMRSNEYGGKGRLLRHELLSITKDGHQIPMSFSGGIIYEKDKEIATFGIFTDLRGIQKIEEDLERTYQMLQQSEKMAGLGRLSAGVAHEINNPMSGIMLYANLVKEELGDEHPLATDMETIIHEAERCKVIVTDLLEFSHQTSYDMSTVDLNEILLKTLALLEKQPLFHNIRIELDLAQDLSNICGNAARLNQVFMNIIVNAAQAMEGKGRLFLQSRHRSQGDIVEIIIQDDGPGIAEQDLPLVFDPFFTTKAHGEGTGLGLSVSYAIVKEHKGSIHLSSKPGEGATFSLKFTVTEQCKTGETG